MTPTEPLCRAENASAPLALPYRRRTELRRLPPSSVPPAASADVTSWAMPLMTRMMAWRSSWRTSAPLDGGQTWRKTLQMVREFREGDQVTPPATLFQPDP
jgi:hypothetical protein